MEIEFFMQIPFECMDDLVQDCIISIANALEIQQSCSMPSV